MEVVSTVVSLALGIIVPWQILRWDMKRLPPERLELAWNDVTFWVAVVVFGPLCLPVHFWRTRRSAVGLLLGFVAMAGAVVVIIGTIAVLELLAGMGS